VGYGDAKGFKTLFSQENENHRQKNGEKENRKKAPLTRGFFINE
jgi:hypothetical protein